MRCFRAVQDWLRFECFALISQYSLKLHQSLDRHAPYTFAQPSKEGPAGTFPIELEFEYMRNSESKHQGIHFRMKGERVSERHMDAPLCTKVHLQTCMRMQGQRLLEAQPSLKMQTVP
eukprot:gnl/MRDRNA2_/MRDRNA2_176774_c0_seq1.p1 gnl/MRDRNA2_/MRDRNA2_176774_c0~~gnl/MRDRNA2_/MRDRNA2_176774_c0_seq1.p1  ORF type:complete len:118 (+),score=6.46 gnl/MRDRNA2_/MRDRNA2_176774_c0_seq1:138-491(+)